MSLKEPGSQGRQNAAPDKFEKYPCGHAAQLVAFTEAEYLPAGHWMQEGPEALGTSADPGGQP